MSDYKNLRVGIINLKLNNIFSICQLFKFLDLKVSIIEDHTHLKKFDLVVLPGDGAFREGMKKLLKINLVNEIKEYSKLKKKNFLVFVSVCNFYLIVVLNSDYQKDLD